MRSELFSKENLEKESAEPGLRLQNSKLLKAELNGDFLAAIGQQFNTWDLKYFEWTLGATADADRGAIPSAVYNAPGWSKMRAARAYDQPASLDEAVEAVMDVATPAAR